MSITLQVKSELVLSAPLYCRLHLKAPEPQYFLEISISASVAPGSSSAQQRLGLLYSTRILCRSQLVKQWPNVLGSYYTCCWKLSLTWVVDTLL